MNQFGIQSIVTKKQYNEETNMYDLEGFIPEGHPLLKYCKGALDRLNDKRCNTTSRSRL